MNEGYAITLSTGRCVDYQVNRSIRARRIRLTLKQDQTLVLTLPVSITVAEAHEFMKKSTPWLEKTLKKRSLSTPRPTPAAYPTVFEFKLTAERFPIRYEWRNTCWVGAKEHKDHILVSGAVLHPELVQETLRLYLIRKAEAVFAPRLRTLSEKCNIPYGNLAIRYQKGRWGSCSSGKDISLNAQMLFLPPEAVEYIMIHELCHIHEMNHSARFWRLVEKWCPDYRAIRRSIRTESPLFLPLLPRP